MKIGIISDLHLHRGYWPPRDRGDFGWTEESMKNADVLVVAGDLATASSYPTFLEHMKERLGSYSKHLIVVKGNHDYYDVEYKDTDEPSVEDNFVVPTFEKKDGKTRQVDFICAPLWSPIKNRDIIEASLNDYNFIPNFTADRCTDLFMQNLMWLEESVRKSRDEGHDIVIATHHLPRHELISKKHEGDYINEAFCVMNEEFESRLAALKPLAWIHGHSHEFMDVTIDGTRYVRNPFGYNKPWHREGTNYHHEFTIEI